MAVQEESGLCVAVSVLKARRTPEEHGLVMLMWNRLFFFILGWQKKERVHLSAGAQIQIADSNKFGTETA